MAELNLTPLNFIQRIKEMDKAERNKLKLKELIDIILQAPDDSGSTLQQLQTDMALLGANVRTIGNLAARNQEEINALKVVNATLTASNTALKDEVATLKNTNNNPGPAVNYDKEIAELRQAINNIEQYLRVNNLEIVGLPEANDGESEENLLLNALNSLDGIDEPIRAEDIDISHPLNTQRRDEKKVHVVRFISRKTKARILAAKKSEQNRLFTFRNNDVFINEHLCPSNRALFAAATGKKKGLGYKYLWTRSGTIFMRKTENSAVITIACENDLNNLV